MKRRTVLRALGVMSLAAAAGVFGLIRAGRGGNRYYSGPVSDHFDGERFFLAEQTRDKTQAELWRWRMAGGKEAWPSALPVPAFDSPPVRVSGAGLRVTLIGHASFLVQVGGLNLLIDPVYSERASPVRFAGPRRINPPGVAMAHLPPIDAVLLTHNHYDHMDVAALKALTDLHRLRIIAPLGNDTILRDAGVTAPISAHDWGETVALSADVSVTLEPCKHWSARGLFDRRHALWTAYTLQTPAGVVHHIGDTAYHQPLFTRIAEKYGPPRLLIMPIGAYEPRWFMRDQHVDPAEAVQAFIDCQAQSAIGHHWGTFQLTDEGVERPVAALAAALEEKGVEARRFRAFRPGQVWDAPTA